VVQDVTDELMTLKSAVATETGAIVSVGTVSVRHWRTDDDIEG
jgi:N-acetylglucosamine kinase-like BadF-type ATPase